MKTLTETIEHYRSYLMARLTRQFGHEQEDAEDILQDAWIKLARQEPPTGGDWSSYLLQTVKTLSMNRVRDNKNRARLHEEKWGKIAKGFNLLEKPAEHISPKTPTDDPHQYRDDFDEMEHNGLC